MSAFKYRLLLRNSKMLDSIMLFMRTVLEIMIIVTRRFVCIFVVRHILVTEIYLDLKSFSQCLVGLI